MRKWILVIIISLFLTACNLDTDSFNNPTQQATNVGNSPTDTVVQPTQAGVQPTSAPLPTHTPSTGGSEPETEATVPIPVTSSDDCEAVASASGVVIDAQQERAEAPQTLPNGQPFPNVEPVPVVSASSVRMSTFGAPSTTALLIQFTPDSATVDRQAYVTSIGGRIDTQLDAIHTYFVTVDGAFDINAAPPSPIVSSIEIDSVATATQADEPLPPNDPRYGEQWGLPVVGLPEAWDSLPPRTVIVAVIDSGVCMSHPDLQGRMVAGYDFVDDDNDPSDVFGHGCGVAGVIAANSNNGIGIAGVAPNVNIMPLRVLDGAGLGNYSNIANAIIYAVDNGADIVNLSLAGTTSSAILEAAVSYAVDRGVVVIAAAGNFGSDRAFYPAAYPSVIAVGSVDPGTLNRSSFSNFGPDVDVYAPGRDILTTNMLGDYHFQSGTSFAAPIVAGITAMSESMNAPLNTEDGIVFLYPPDFIPNC
ncbi:MAG: S8 family serine peptidase [Chloroflexota bacterium]